MGGMGPTVTFLVTVVPQLLVARAVNVTLPAPTTVATPDATLIVATLGSEEDHMNPPLVGTLYVADPEHK